jgi:hypothetical protein
MSKKPQRSKLDRIVETTGDEALTIRVSIDDINAKFSTEPESMKERAKLERLIRMLTQQHSRTLAQCIKLVVMGILKNKTDESMETIKAHMMALTAGQKALQDHRGAIYKGQSLIVASPEMLRGLPLEGGE